MQDDLVLVYGGTGTQGAPVVAQLLAAGRRVRVVTRDPSRAQHWAQKGAEVVAADLGDPESLAVANTGVARVVLQLPLQYDFDLHEAYGRNAIDAARAGGVELVVFNTSAHVMPGTDLHIYRARQEVIDYLTASGLASIVLRPTFFLENFLGPWMKPAIVDQGVLAFPLPEDFPMSWVSADDLAAYAVSAVDRPDLAGQQLDVGGPEALTGNQLAQGFSEVLGRPVRYLAISPDDYQRNITPLFGETVAFEVTQQVRWIIGLGSGAVDMAAAQAIFEVPGLPLRTWLRGYEWTPAHSRDDASRASASS